MGAFYQWQSNGAFVTQAASYLGASPAIAPFNPSLLSVVTTDVPSANQETSLFGSLTLHLGANTELTGGVRHLMAVSSASANLQYVKAPLIAGLSCARLGMSPSPTPGNCTIQNLSRHTSDTPNIYNVSLSHHLTRDLLVYVNTGTSWRPGPTSVGLRNPTNDPVLNSLIFLDPETSRSYEVGAKSTFLDGRARVNVALWRQHFHNTFIFTPGVPYVDKVNNTVSTFGFTSNADATVSGIDFDSAFQITPDWNIALQASYADGHIDAGGRVPCNDSNGDGIPDNGRVTSISQFGGSVMRFCNGGSVSRNPLWNATLQTEYTHPVSEGMSGFLRGLVTYYPENKRAEPGFAVDNYSLMNLYAGVRSEDGAWEVSLFARNALGNETLLDRNTQTLNFNVFKATSNYQAVTGITPRREVGVHVRYAWGSR